MKILLLACAVALAGCSTKSIDEMSYTEVKAYGAVLHKKCVDQGVKPGPEMQLCINQEARADQSRRQKQKEIGAALAGAGEAYSQSMQANRTVNCTSTGYGNTVRTSCY